MTFAQIETYSLTEILGDFQFVTLAVSVLIVLIAGVFGVIRGRFRITGMALIFSLLVCLWNVGRLFLYRGFMNWEIGMENIGTDPSVAASNLGHFQSSVGANLMMLSFTGALASLFYLLTLLRTKAKG